MRPMGVATLLEGIVTDNETGGPAYGVQVIFTGDDYGVGASDANGYYRIPLCRGGNGTLNISQFDTATPDGFVPGKPGYL